VAVVRTLKRKLNRAVDILGKIIFVLLSFGLLVWAVMEAAYWLAAK
jgi:TRAP-type mannitol/chloroaromatic compound transport system permease small subunit